MMARATLPAAMSIAIVDSTPVGKFEDRSKLATIPDGLFDTVKTLDDGEPLLSSVYQFGTKVPLKDGRRIPAAICHLD
jgi:hypothetical protein